MDENWQSIEGLEFRHIEMGMPFQFREATRDYMTVHPYVRFTRIEVNFQGVIAGIDCYTSYSRSSSDEYWCYAVREDSDATHNLGTSNVKVYNTLGAGLRICQRLILLPEVWLTLA